jgi:phosphodiesterase/alkaline phosphatase D-like protein
VADRRRRGARGARSDAALGDIGAGSEPFGQAIVEVERGGRVVARVETEERNHAWVGGLEPDTGYRYRVLVDGIASAGRR